MKKNIYSLKSLEERTLKQKENMLKTYPSIINDLSLDEQLYFLSQDPERYFMYCDEDIRDYLLENFPDYFVNYANDEVREILVDCGRIDPAYVTDYVTPLSVNQESLFAMLKDCASYMGVKEELEEKLQEQFKDVEPERI